MAVIGFFLIMRFALVPSFVTVGKDGQDDSFIKLRAESDRGDFVRAREGRDFLGVVLSTLSKEEKLDDNVLFEALFLFNSGALTDESLLDFGVAVRFTLFSFVRKDFGDVSTALISEPLFLTTATTCNDGVAASTCPLLTPSKSPF